MKHLIKFRFRILTAVIFGTALLFGGMSECLITPQALAQQAPATKPDESGGATPIDMHTLSDRLPDQSHAMQDAGYHFENLWFAGTNQNWPLASYYLRKTRSYLELAVQIKPVRKISSGTDVDLRGILEAVDHGMLAQIDTAVAHRDLPGFERAFRETVEGCNACHSACQRSYLHVQVPIAPATAIINFVPPATDKK